MTQDEVTKEFGLAAPKAAINVGKDEADQPDEVWFLANKRGLMRITPDAATGRLGVQSLPVSREVGDIVSRIIAGKLTDLLGQQMVVDNRTGATGMIGAEMAAHAAPNGYTLLAGSVVTHAQLPITYKKLPYDPVKDFMPISILYLTDVLLGVHPSLPVKTVKEFIAYAKSPPNELNYASAGTGSVAHLAGVMLISMTGITSTHIPYKGGAANSLAVAAGESPWLAAPLGSTIGQVRAGRRAGARGVMYTDRTVVRKKKKCEG
jgi:hypothetical protein